MNTQNRLAHLRKCEVDAGNLSYELHKAGMRVGAGVRVQSLYFRARRRYERISKRRQYQQSKIARQLQDKMRHEGIAIMCIQDMIL